jgi:hypothetical protein
VEVSGQLHALTALPTWKEYWHPLEKKLDGLQSWFGSSGKEKKSLPLPGIEPLSSSP